MPPQRVFKRTEFYFGPLRMLFSLQNRFYTLNEKVRMQTPRANKNPSKTHDGTFIFRAEPTHIINQRS